MTESNETKWRRDGRMVDLQEQEIGGREEVGTCDTNCRYVWYFMRYIRVWITWVVPT